MLTCIHPEGISNHSRASMEMLDAGEKCTLKSKTKVVPITSGQKGGTTCECHGPSATSCFMQPIANSVMTWQVQIKAKSCQLQKTDLKRCCTSVVVRKSLIRSSELSVVSKFCWQVFELDSCMRPQEASNDGELDCYTVVDATYLLAQVLLDTR